ncbi:ABC-2 type transport system permease protein [Friedmanniella luteola]|uniref:ABC-2 type transport system permease protein n=1 Tax=Friedmanniella luteola TaxID=546871 RepID=A0A1H1UNZ2_9ACTN|nr:ABC-2 family transporter protein [Friedmanniella luteola]SDS74217.1 ABC-2 type transport system permease protein [Friedmanniella luteola]
MTDAERFPVREVDRPGTAAPQPAPGFSPAALGLYYRRQFASALANNLAYRGAVAIWVVTSVIHPLVFIVVWRTVAGSGSTGGYTADQFVAYFLVMMVVDHLTFIWHMWEFEYRIRTGAFSPLLLRPVHPIHNDVCENVSYKLVGLVGIVPAAVLLAVVFDADLTGTTPATVLAFLPAVLLAMVLRFVVEWCVALSAFWLTKVSALNAVFFSLFTFLGGQFAPLSVLPGWMQAVAAWTPFPWTLAHPVEVLLGRRTGGELLVGYGAQLAWIVVALVVLRVLWSRATRRYSAVGA